MYSNLISKAPKIDVTTIIIEFFLVAKNTRLVIIGSSTEDPPTPGGSSASSETGMNRPPCLPPKPRKKRIGATVANVKRPKLFGGSLEEYVEATGEEIPLVVVGCIRMLTLYGLHHQGIFRVSGSHTEINAFREAFERGTADSLYRLCYTF